ncbi:hypothetical protein OHA01_26465 [Micromonospora zamorensis]|uniref:hypothetical protein n=1 Tax=Micromonospora zamorensis TaxID=709883 RepID=UPI00386B6C40|nr:hypothetical protein OHA01_26465 [Micromonospora zamorensis]
MDRTDLPHHYFVAFSAGGRRGNTEFFLDQPIRNLADINKIQDALCRSVPGAVITGWQRFETT